MKRRNGKIIWTVYFDSTKPRDKGRRVPKSLSVEKPRVEELALAAEKAGYKDVAIDRNAKFPAYWYDSEGRIFVKTTEKKSIVIRKIAEKLVELRRSAKKK
ncbi:signal recognition particle subunit SRP19/SEC65 family protein [Infirmifilum lucidum]|uniref:Signal recognition particle 19 kDa protein n=1 Tax=Infirmifilum lucidum TaxID=2776706 RepID=A0A7L9FGY7_9CREN|nr:signal recognition particle subunit SRP19/SEC65 family protein [Infirmifilum lucidum]QOJ78273.1 signal recognition particle subunit SRP19/SEC65 family protein [Infirmifilum lucidum]